MLLERKLVVFVGHEPLILATMIRFRLAAKLAA